MLDAFRRTVAFLAGLIIVIGGLINECPRVAGIAIGLLLMGIFTVPEVIGIVKGAAGGVRKEDNDN